VAGAAALLVPAACTRDLWRLESAGAVALTTSGPWSSMMYLARTDSGIIAIDLGWLGAEATLRRALTRLHATPGDVRFVFLTHAHRDHIHGWRLLRTARFVLGAREVPFLTGETRYAALGPRLGDGTLAYPRPAPRELRLIPLGADSAIVLGADTVWAFALPGHTAGSMAYLFRGVLFAGDAINWRPWTGFRGARAEFSDDAPRSRTSLRDLWRRLDTSRVRTACTAHAKCGPADSVLRAATSR
jgi:glyoxylase-like metal-dependent hydrolase (beta-lactamase superfamily II)